MSCPQRDGIPFDGKFGSRLKGLGLPPGVLDSLQTASPRPVTTCGVDASSYTTIRQLDNDQLRRLAVIYALAWSNQQAKDHVNQCPVCRDYQREYTRR